MSCCDKKYDYSILWRPIDINKCRIRNRKSMSGMGTFTPTTVDQVETESGLRYYEERAKGGIGLIHNRRLHHRRKDSPGRPHPRLLHRQEHPERHPAHRARAPLGR